MRTPWMMFTIQNTGVQNTPMKMVPLQRQKSVVRLHQPTSASASYWMVIAHAVHAVQPAGIAGRGFTQKLDEEFGTVIVVIITRRRSVVDFGDAVCTVMTETIMLVNPQYACKATAANQWT